MDRIVIAPQSRPTLSMEDYICLGNWTEIIFSVVAELFSFLSTRQNNVFVFLYCVLYLPLAVNMPFEQRRNNIFVSQMDDIITAKYSSVELASYSTKSLRKGRHITTAYVRQAIITDERQKPTLPTARWISRPPRPPWGDTNTPCIKRVHSS
jgi:hypothetical protein